MRCDPQWFSGGLLSCLWEFLCIFGNAEFKWTQKPPWALALHHVFSTSFFVFLGVGWLELVFLTDWEKRHLRCPQYRFLCLFAALSMFLHIANSPGQSHRHIWRCSHRGSTKQIPERIAFIEFNHLECNPSSLWPLSPDVPLYLKALQGLTPVLDLSVCFCPKMCTAVLRDILTSWSGDVSLSLHAFPGREHLVGKGAVFSGWEVGGKAAALWHLNPFLLFHFTFFFFFSSFSLPAYLLPSYYKKSSFIAHIREFKMNFSRPKEIENPNLTKIPQTWCEKLRIYIKFGYPKFSANIISYSIYSMVWFTANWELLQPAVFQMDP